MVINHDVGAHVDVVTVGGRWSPLPSALLATGTVTLTLASFRQSLVNHFQRRQLPCWPDSAFWWCVDQKGHPVENGCKCPSPSHSHRQLLQPLQGQKQGTCGVLHRQSSLRLDPHGQELKELLQVPTHPACGYPRSVQWPAASLGSAASPCSPWLAMTIVSLAARSLPPGSSASTVRSSSLAPVCALRNSWYASALW